MAKSSGGRKTIAQGKAPAKPSPSTLTKPGVTAPIQKPSKSTVNQVGITPPHPKGGKR
jgi:hypothetical protein